MCFVSSHLISAFACGKPHMSTSSKLATDDVLGKLSSFEAVAQTGIALGSIRRKQTLVSASPVVIVLAAVATMRALSRHEAKKSSTRKRCRVVALAASQHPAAAALQADSSMVPRNLYVHKVSSEPSIVVGMTPISRPAYVSESCVAPLVGCLTALTAQADAVASSNFGRLRAARRIQGKRCRSCSGRARANAFSSKHSASRERNSRRSVGARLKVSMAMETPNMSYDSSRLRTQIQRGLTILFSTGCRTGRERRTMSNIRGSTKSSAMYILEGNCGDIEHLRGF